MARLEQLNAIVDVRIRAEQVLPAIVVEIEQAVAPAAQIPAQSGHAARIGGVHERTFPLVAEQRKSFTGQGSDADIRQAVVIVIPKVHPHTGDRFAMVQQRDSGLQSHFFERSVATIME